MKAWAPLAAIGALSIAVWAGEQIPAQPAKPVPVEQDDLSRITVDVTRVGMQFTVLDKKGRFVTDLKKEDFDVIESKRPQAIQDFNSESDLPLRLAVLVDTSNSIRDRFKFEQEAASEFLKTTVKANLDKAMVVSFDTTPDLVADLMDDTEKLERAVRGLRPGGGTAMYDAIYFACRDKLSAGPAPAQVPPRGGHPERWRRQSEPLYKGAGARDGAQVRCGSLRHLDEYFADRIRWRQGAAVSYGGDRRPGVFPLQGGRPGAVV